MINTQPMVLVAQPPLNVARPLHSAARLCSNSMGTVSSHQNSAAEKQTALHTLCCLLYDIGDSEAPTCLCVTGGLKHTPGSLLAAVLP